MISHDNIVWETHCMMSYFNLREKSEVLVDYLPLSHIAAGGFDVYVMLLCKGTVYFADKMALRGTLIETIQEARPTIFIGVPRVFEKIKERLMEKSSQVTGFKKTLATSFKKIGTEYHTKGKNVVQYLIGKPLFYNKVKTAMGFDRCRQFVSSAAPLSDATIKYFLGIDMVISQLYGMSETTGGTVGTGSRYIPNSIGKPVPGSLVELRNVDGNGVGNMTLKGRNIFMGYLNKEDAIGTDLDPNGWITSGDSACYGNQGNLYIKGRLKEILITSGGKNIAPLVIENEIKEHLPFISNVVVIGDKKKFLSVLLTFKVEIDPTTQMPTDKLMPVVTTWLLTLGCKAKTVGQVLSSTFLTAVHDAIQLGIDLANQAAVSRAATVKKWKLLPQDFSIPGGELGPTQKIKRHVVHEKYAQEIESIYAQ